VLAGVAEHHRLHVDRRAEVVRDALLAAVEDGAGVFQDRKTASTAPSSWSRGSCGKCMPWLVMMSL
jgi:predicted metalloprotease